MTVKVVAAWFKLTSDFAHLVVRDIKWFPNPGWKARAQAIVRGGFIALPLLAVFTGLFVSADDAFRDIVTRTLSFQGFDGAQVCQSILIFFFCAVLARRDVPNDADG